MTVITTMQDWQDWQDWQDQLLSKVEKIKNVNKWLNNECENRRVDIVKVIINLRLISIYDIRTLHYAYKGGHHEIIKIITKMCKLTNNSTYRRTMWKYSMEGACEGGYIDVVTECINQVSQQKILHNVLTYYQVFNDFLKNAGKSGNIDIVKIIIDFLKLKGNYYYLENAMYGACISGHLDVVKFAIKKCSYLSINKGILLACKGGHLSIVKYLIPKHAKKHTNYLRDYLGECLMDSCEGGHIDVINYILEKGINNGIDKISNLNQGLVGACRGNKMDIVELMILKGCTDWHAGLVGACDGGYLDVVKFMISKGGKGATDLKDGFVAACAKNHSKVAEYIFMLDPQLYKYDHYSDSNTILMHACILGYDKIINFVVSYDKTFINIEEAMLLACLHKQIGVIKVLLNAGAKVRNNHVVYVCKGDDIELAQLILDNISDELTSDTLTEALRVTGWSDGNTDIGILLINKGARLSDNTHITHKCFFKKFKVYQIYCRSENILPFCDLYTSLLTKYPPYILLVGCRVNKKCCLNKLPIELFRLLFEY